MGVCLAQSRCESELSYGPIACSSPFISIPYCFEQTYICMYLFQVLGCTLLGNYVIQEYCFSMLVYK